jgi:hypothetical protein
VFYLLAQALQERNPASHAIMWIAFGTLAILFVIARFEIADWLRYRIADRRRRKEDTQG